MRRLVPTLLLVTGALAAAEKPAPPWHAAPPFDYLVRRTEASPAAESSLQRAWGSAVWSQAQTLHVDRFHEKPDPLYPKTQARLLHDERGIHVFFRVEDRHVRSVNTDYQSPVWRDACVEFFVEPDVKRGYLNMEINAGGALLMKHHDPNVKPGAEQSPSGFMLVLVAKADAAKVKIEHSLPKVVDPEIKEPVVWYVRYYVPLEVLEKYFGPLRPISGRTWRANFYKISQDNSHPHRATWAPIPPDARAGGFHQPKFFAPIRFE